MHRPSAPPYQVPRSKELLHFPSHYTPVHFIRATAFFPEVPDDRPCHLVPSHTSTPSLYRCEDIAVHLQHCWFGGFTFSVLQPGISVTCAKLYLPLEEEKKSTPRPGVSGIGNTRYVHTTIRKSPPHYCDVSSALTKVGDWKSLTHRAGILLTGIGCRCPSAPYDCRARHD